MGTSHDVAPEHAPTVTPAPAPAPPAPAPMAPVPLPTVGPGLLAPDVEAAGPEHDPSRTEGLARLRRSSDASAGVPPEPGGGADPHGGTTLGAGLQANLRRRAGQGRPLDPATASDLGGRLGADFGNVRIHADNEAHTIARSVQATAFTLGSDIYFTQGTYAPSTRAGRSLLAHELTHVRQHHEGRSTTASGTGVTVGRVDDPAEREAELVARQIDSGGPVEGGGVDTPGPDLHRSTSPDGLTVRRAPGGTGQELAGRAVERSVGLTEIPAQILDLTAAVKSLQGKQAQAALPEPAPGAPEREAVKTFADDKGFKTGSGFVGLLTGAYTVIDGAIEARKGYQNLDDDAISQNLGADQMASGASTVVDGATALTSAASSVADGLGKTALPEVFDPIVGFQQGAVQTKRVVEDAGTAIRLQGNKADIRRLADQDLPFEQRAQRMGEFLAALNGAGKYKSEDVPRWTAFLGRWQGSHPWDPLSAVWINHQADRAQKEEFLAFLRENEAKDFGYGSKIRNDYHKLEKAKADAERKRTEDEAKAIRKAQDLVATLTKKTPQGSPQLTAAKTHLATLRDEAARRSAELFALANPEEVAEAGHEDAVRADAVAADASAAGGPPGAAPATAAAAAKVADAAATKGAREAHGRHQETRALGAAASFAQGRLVEKAAVNTVKAAGSFTDAAGTFTAGADAGATKVAGKALKLTAAAYEAAKTVAIRASRVYQLARARNEIAYGTTEPRGVWWHVKMFVGGDIEKAQAKTRAAILRAEREAYDAHVALRDAAKADNAKIAALWTKKRAIAEHQAEVARRTAYTLWVEHREAISTHQADVARWEKADLAHQEWDRQRLVYEKLDEDAWFRELGTSGADPRNPDKLVPEAGVRPVLADQYAGPLPAAPALPDGWPDALPALVEPAPILPADLAAGESLKVLPQLVAAPSAAAEAIGKTAGRFQTAEYAEEQIKRLTPDFLQRLDDLVATLLSSDERLRKQAQGVVRTLLNTNLAGLVAAIRSTTGSDVTVDALESLYLKSQPGVPAPEAELAKKQLGKLVEALEGRFKGVGE